MRADQRFCFILRVPLLLSKVRVTLARAWGNEDRRRQLSVALTTPLPVIPSPQEQVCSQPTVGFSVRGHRQRA
jgi:hypothetical protein